MCRFGLPHTIIFDYGINFTSQDLTNFCPGTRSLIASPLPTTLRVTARAISATAQSSTVCARA